MTSVYHPQSNPAERVMRELGRMFRTYCHSQHEIWSRHVPYVEWVLNNTVHEATDCTPQELFLVEGQKYNPLAESVEFPPRTAEDHQVKLTMAREIQMSKAEKRKLRLDRKGIPTKFNVGDRILIRSLRLSSMTERVSWKFFLLFEGPYFIVEIKTQNVYTVEDPKTKIIRGTFNVIHLRKYLSPNDRC